MPQTFVKLKISSLTSKNNEVILCLQIALDCNVRKNTLDSCCDSVENDMGNGVIIKVFPTLELINNVQTNFGSSNNNVGTLMTHIENNESVTLESCHKNENQQFRNCNEESISMFDFIQKQIERLQMLGKFRTSETYTSALNSFKRFRGEKDLYFDEIDADLIEMYESYLRSRHVSRNTSSFYMRILRANYNKAVEENLTIQREPFKRVYTGVDKTLKRALELKDVRKIKQVDLSGCLDLDFARDMFLFSFYMRGMSFVDMAYLRKKDLRNEYVVYSRKKTRQQITVRWEKKMQDLIDKYDTENSPYLLPIITIDQNELENRRQYIRKEQFVNRKLKILGDKAKIGSKLTLYVARHSWASIAQYKNVPLSIISNGMGHESVHTTQIYLSSIQSKRIDQANNEIMEEL